MSPQHPTATSATGTDELGLFRIGRLKHQSLFLILFDDGYRCISGNFPAITAKQGHPGHAADGKAGFLAVRQFAGFTLD